MRRDIQWGPASTPAPSKKPSRYLVNLITPTGVGQIEVPTFLGREAAGRRARIAAVQQGWGDLDEVTVGEITLIEEA